MRSSRVIIAGLVAALAVAAVPVAQAAQGETAAASRHFEGRVTSVDRERHTFRIRSESGSRVRFRVTSRTRFERVSGFSGLRRGSAVEVTARRADGRWVARKIERQGSDRRDSDDGPDHHESGDDHDDE